MILTHDDLLMVLEIIECVRKEYTTKRMKEKYEFSYMKYLYWVGISEQRGKAPVFINWGGY